MVAIVFLNLPGVIKCIHMMFRLQIIQLSAFEFLVMLPANGKVTRVLHSHSLAK